MSDLALIWDPSELVADLAIEANDLVREDGLQTAVLLSLLLDRQADDSDQLPPGETDRRGWWADGVPVVAGDQVGSRLWLLTREKQTPAVRARAERYAREALQWLIEDRVVDRLDVVASFPGAGELGLSIELIRSGEATRYSFFVPAPPAQPLDINPSDAGVVTADDAYSVMSDGTYLTRT